MGKTKRIFDRYGDAAKVVALCLPPVIMSLAGLAALSRRSGRAAGAVDDNKLAAGRGKQARLNTAIRGYARRAKPRS